MRLKQFIFAFVAMLLSFASPSFAQSNVAKVGNTEYATIDEAVAAWANNTTLTLLADVTLSGVVTLSSQEHHYLALGTYTMTAYNGKNAIEIKSYGRADRGERGALTITADAENPGGINAGTKACIYYKYDATLANNNYDRPIIYIKGGVFVGSSYSGIGCTGHNSAQDKCATFDISGGTFNCGLSLTKAKLLISGGTFNYPINCTGGGTSHRQISGGTFKSWTWMTADAPSKFWVGTSQGNYNVGVYVDDNGYLVVGGDVVKEPGNFEASSANYGGWSSYLEYSSAKNNGLYYTSVEEALADNNKTTGSVTVYVDELDMSGISYKGTIVVPAESKITIKNAPENLDVKDENGKTLTPNANGTYSTVAPTAKIGDVEYATLAEAVAAAQAGDEIKLLADATVEGTLALPAGIKLTSNGHKINGSIRMLGDLELNGPLTITGGLWVGKGGETLTATLSGGKLTANYFMFQHGTYTINADIDAVYGYLSFGGTFEVNSTIHTTGANGEVLYINGNVTLNDGAVLDSDNSVFVSNDNAVLTLKPGSKVDSNLNITKGGAKVNIDATGMTAGASANITGTVTNSGNGTIAVVGNDKLEAQIVDGKIVLAAKPVAKIGSTTYATLEEAFKAATSGCTIDILSDVTVDYAWDARNTGGKFTVPVTINGNGKTIKFTGSINDNNWNTVFRFGENATVNNLTVDISNATGAQRVISAQKSLNVDGLKIVGEAKYGVIYGEGASAADLAATEIVVKNSTLDGTRRALSDNEGGKDVKSVVIEGNTFNANVYVSAFESIAFNNNTVAGETDLRSYAADNVLNVQAQGNTLATDKKNYIYAKTIVAQDGFETENPPLKVATKAELNAALAAAKDGDVITLTADIDYGTDQLAIAKAITLDLGGKTLTTRNAWGGMSIKNNPTVKNGNIVHASNTAAIKVWNATAFEDLVIDVQGKGDANKTIGGIVLQSGSTTRVGSIKNVTIKGAALTNGIETYNCGDATENVIGSMENVTIDALGTGLLISAPCGTATNCDITGGVNGVEIFIKGNYSASLYLVNSKVNGGVYAHDEFSSNPSIVNNGTLNFTADAATTGASAEDVTLEIARAEADNVKGVLNDVMENAQAKLNNVYYATLAEAFAAATEGETITLLADATPALKSQSAITKAAVIDLGGKTLTLTEDDLYFGTTTFKNGTIVVDPSVHPSTAVFWMFANQTLTFDAVKVVATGVTGTYLIGLDGNNSDLNLLNGSEILIENTTALDLDVICVNASTGNDIVVENSKVKVTNLDGRVFFRGNYTVKDSEVSLAGITKAGFRIEADQTLSIEGTSTVTIEGEPRDGGIHITDATATYTKDETATVNATVNAPAKGSNSFAYTKEENGNVRVWGEGGGNAKESYELKLYSGETLIATTKLNNVGNVIDGDVYVTWNFYYPQSNDEYWTTTWEAGHPNSAAQPTEVKLYIDGTLVATTAAKMSGADDINPVVWRNLGGVAVADLLGEGTETSPYLISNKKELLWFQAKVDELAADGYTQFAGKYFKLTADIDLAGENWNPIGSMSGDHGSFKGVFDGGNHTISNLKVEQAGNGIGLFARTTGNAVIKNLKLNNVSVKSTDNSNYAGAVVGNAYASTKIENVHVRGNVLVSGRGYIGGIAGHGYVVMDNVSVVATGDGQGNNKGLITSTFWCAGGILGYAGEGATNIMNAKVENVVVTSAAGGLGAIVGMAEDNNGTQPISGSNLSAKNVEIKTYIGDFGDAYANYALGYLYGGNPTSKLTGELSVENVTLATSNGVAPTPVDAVAKVNNAIYFSLAEAIAAAQPGETVMVFEGTYAVPTMKAGITIEGVGNVLLEGTLSGTLENLTLKNLHIKGGNAQRYAYAKGNLVFENVTFEATSVYALHFDGITEGTTLLYKNCTIIGWAAMGGSPASCVFDGCTIKDNGTYGVIRTYFDATIKDCTFDVANANTGDVYQDGIHAVGGAKITVNGCTNANGDMKDLVNVNGASVVTVDGVVFKNAAKIGDNYYATINEAIAAAQPGETVEVFEGTYAVPAMKAGITIEGVGNVLLEGTLSGTLENLTLKNLHIKGGNAQRYAYAKGNLEFENVTFEATSVYALHFDGITEGTTLLYKDCTIIGWAAMGGSPASCVFDGCTIKDNGTYGVIRTYFDATINNCTFDVANANTGDVYQDGIHAVGGAKIAVNGCTNANGDMKDLVNVNGASVVTVDGVEFKNAANIGETYYETLDAAFAAAQDGDEVKVLTAGTYALSTSGKNITITGAVEGVVFDNIGAKNMGSANVTFNNVTFDYYPNVNYTGLQHSGNLTYNNCIINGQVFLYGQSETFNKCTFNQNSADAYNVWTYGAKDVDFNECTFNSVGKSVLVYNESTTATNDVAFTNCVLKASAPVEGKAAIEIDTSLSAGATITVDGATTATGFGSGNVSGNSLWNNKKGSNTDANNDITVVVNNETVLAPVTFVAKIGETGYRTLAEAISAAQAGETVKVFAGTYPVPAMKAGITVEGAVNADGTPAVLLEGTLKGTLDNLTLKNLHIKGGNAQRYAYAKGNLVFENVTFEATSVYALHFDGITEGTTLLYKDCTIIGWAAMGGSPASCVFEGCTIKDNGTYGVIRTYFDATIKDCTFDVANANTGDVYQDGIHAVGGAKIAVNGCTNVNGEMKDLVNVNGASVVTVDGVEFKNAAKIGDNYYATINEAIAAIGAGDVVIELLDNATFDYNARDAYGTAETTSVTINGNGKTLTLNQKNSDWASIGLANANGKLLLNNMLIEKTGYGDTSGAWNTHAIIFSCLVEMNNVTVNNGIAVQAGATLNNVTINEANGYYGLWVNGNGQSVTVNGGAINATNGGRGIKVADQYIDAPAQVTLNVTDTKFNTAKKAAVLVTSTAGAKVTASNVDITNVAQDNVNFVWVDEDRAANYGAVEVTGATVAQESVGSFPIIVKNGDKVVSYFKNLDDLFDNVSAYAKVSNVTVELTGDVVATKVVKTNSLKTYNFVTNVAEGVTMDLQYADNWNYFRKVNIGENVTVKCKYLVFSTESTIAGTVDAYYPYINGGKVTVAETGTLKYEGGDALQVKGNGAVLTVNGTVIAPTINVWVGNAQLVVSGANAKVQSKWIDIWDGTPSVAVNNGATIETNKIKVSRGGEITVTDANLVAAESIEVGHNGNSAGKLTESGNSTITGEIKMTATGSTVVSDGGLNVTTAIEGHKVVYDAENKMYKVVAIGDLSAKIGDTYYETLAEAITAAQPDDVITILKDITEDVTINKSVTIDGADKQYTGNISVSGTSTAATVKNVNFVNGLGYAITTNRIKSITVENCTVTNYGNGFLYANKSTPAVTVKNVTVDGGKYGFRWLYGSTATLENVKMTNVTYGLEIHNYAGKTITLKNCEISSIAIEERNGYSGVQTFKLEGCNTITTLPTSQYAKLIGATITGTTFYGSVKGMVEKAVTDQTVQLLSDITLDATGYEMASCDGYPSFVHVEGKAITVDLNGKTIAADVDADDVSNFVIGVFSTDKGGELTLVDNSAEGTGTVELDAEEGKVYSLICNYNPGCKITINGGKYVANMVRDCLIFSGAYEDALVTVNGGNFTLGNVGTGENGKPWIFNVLGAGDNYVLVNGGTFNADINRQHWSNEVYVAKECYTVANTDGTYTVKEGAVAYVNEGMLTGPYFVRKNVGYATLGEAFAAADDDDTVTLLEDITYTKETGSINGGYVDGLVYTGDKNFTVDFAGHTVTENGDINDYLVYLKNTGEKDNEITFKNGTIAINSQSTATAWAAITVGSGSSTHATTLNLDNMEVINGNPNAAANQVIRSRNGATVNLNEGTLVTSNGTSYGVVAETTATVNINDGAKVVHTNSGTTGGNTVYTAVSGNGVINIYDGAVIESDNYGIHNMTTGNAVINIYGGTITAPVIVHAATNGGSGESADVYISGGRFFGAMEEYTNNANIHVSNGVFDRPVAEEFCAEDYAPCDNGDGTYGVYYAVIDEVHFVDGEFTEYNNSRNMTVGTLTYKRYAVSTGWNQLYVPFEVPVSELADQGFEVAYINGVRRGDDNYDGELDDFVMEVIYIHGGNADGSEKTLKANYPYFIRYNGEDGNSSKDLIIELEDVMLYAAKNATFDCTTFTEKFEITGTTKTVKATDFEDGYSNKYGVNAKTGKWKVFGETATMRPFRFYMAVTSREDNSPIVSIASMSIVVRGEELPDGTTLIYDINAETGDNVIYDLNGRRVLETEKGNIYIINGKKVLVK